MDPPDVGSRLSSAERRPRVAVLWTHVTGYVHGELRALVDAGAEVLLIREEEPPEAPFDARRITAGLQAPYHWSSEPDAATIRRELDHFDPDVLIVCSWNVGAYREIARSYKGQALRILAMDNQWWGTLKQWGGVVLSRLVIQPAYDAAFVPADTQAAFARRLGFADERILWGLNTCDYPRFAAVARQRGDAPPPKSFLFAGRLVSDKAIDVLAGAYNAYRTAVSDPWPLVIAGTGPEAHLLESQEGVEMLGFVQPDHLPDVFSRAGCLVLSSRFEPWALVIHEAAAAELPVVCTRVCGATSRLVLEGYNGLVVRPEDATGLAGALLRIHGLDDDERRMMGAASGRLAGQFTPERWASTLLGRVPDLRQQVGLTPEPWNTPSKELAQ